MSGGGGEGAAGSGPRKLTASRQHARSIAASASSSTADSREVDLALRSCAGRSDFHLRLHACMSTDRSGGMLPWRTGRYLCHAAAPREGRGQENRPAHLLRGLPGEAPSAPACTTCMGSSRAGTGPPCTGRMHSFLTRLAGGTQLRRPGDHGMPPKVPGPEYLLQVSQVSLQQLGLSVQTLSL